MLTLAGMPGPSPKDFWKSATAHWPKFAGAGESGRGRVGRGFRTMRSPSGDPEKLVRVIRDSSAS
jgi:hypothetical protein